jgi:hypothetical protein
MGWDDVDEEFERGEHENKIARDAIIDYLDATPHRLRSAVQDAHDRIRDFSVTEFALAESALGHHPPDTTAAFLHAYRIIESYVNEVLTYPLLDELLAPLLGHYSTEARPEALFSKKLLRAIPSIVLGSDGLDERRLHQAWEKALSPIRPLRNAVVHGTRIPTTEEARTSITVAREFMEIAQQVMRPAFEGELNF